MGNAAPNGMNIFPLAMPTTPLAPEFLQDTVVQLLELINAQCAQSSGGSISGAVTANPLTLTDGSNVVIGTSAGSIFGQASSKLAFFGSSAGAVARQVNASASAVATTAVATGAVYGFTTAAQGNALIALANAIIAALGPAGYYLLSPS